MILLLKAIQVILFAFGAYVLLIGLGGFASRKCRRQFAPSARFAVIVPAHNEEKVIGQLVENLKLLDYPRELYDIFVVADNCTDNTKKVAQKSGAFVLERFDNRRKGKGYALEYAFAKLHFTPKGGRPDGICPYDAAVIFDADNLVAPNFLRVMNNRLLTGEKIIQSFIDSKNPDDSWVAAAFSITFWLNNRFAMLARYNLGLCAALAGTGMCIAREVLQNVGWSTTTLTEDLEYSMKALTHGYKTCVACETRIYDEKALTFSASCRQRLRWARGQISVAFQYIPVLLAQGVREKNPVKLESALRLTQLFVIVAGGGVGLLGLLQPKLVLLTSVYYSLAEAVPPLALVFLFAPYLFPAALFLLDSPPLRPFRFLPLFPLFTYSWAVIIVIGLLTYRNRAWMPTLHTRAISFHGLKISSRC